MLIYHTYEKSNGFDLNKIDFDRGIFAIEPWWVNDPRYADKYTKWHPNEFGDTTVELDIDDNVKTYKGTNQPDFLEKEFPNSQTAKMLIHKYEMGQMNDREDWHKMDTFIGRYLRKKGYKLIHYTGDEMYGDVWAILDKSVIRGVNFPPKKS